MSQFSTLMGAPSTSGIAPKKIQQQNIVVNRNFSEAEADLDDVFFQG